MKYLATLGRTRFRFLQAQLPTFGEGVAGNAQQTLVKTLRFSRTRISGLPDFSWCSIPKQGKM
jgi:hypothetical protein